ncbi:MAG: hypothetical protein R2879_15365 [Saprospiraceae bacterium]
MEKVKMYLSARISEDAHAWNNEICDIISSHFDIFKPQDHNPYNVDHRLFEKEVYRIDLEAMMASEIGLLLAPYGRDCAWEVGWYACSDKPMVLVAERDYSWTRDWMIKGGIDAVLTSCPIMYDRLKQDKIVHDKIIKVNSRADLGSEIANFLSEYKASLKSTYGQVA